MAKRVEKIEDKYRFRREIGRGAYGSVWYAIYKCRSAREIATNADVAIKKIGQRNFDETILAKRALRELKLLRHLNGHDNVANFIDCDVDMPGNPLFTELYFIFNKDTSSKDSWKLI